ncbi:MAG: phosphoribosylanthranilate isomerase [Pseudomonadota bacterium]
MRTRVKICCIANAAEAKVAIDAGADAIGLVANMPSGPGPIPDDTIKSICTITPPPVSTFLLTSRTTAKSIADHVQYTGASTVQIVSHISRDESAELARALPNTKRVQVIHVENENALSLIPVYTGYVDAFLLDSGKPSAEIAELGGTGRTHDWEISRRFVQQSPRPVFLAGGLNADNIERAITNVKPYGVDLCSSVRTDGNLDPTKLNRFMRALRRIPIDDQI